METPNEQAARVEIQVAQMKLKLEPILKEVGKLNLIEIASLVATICGQVQNRIVDGVQGEMMFAHWFVTVQKGLFRSIPEGNIKVEARYTKMSDERTN